MGKLHFLLCLLTAWMIGQSLWAAALYDPSHMDRPAPDPVWREMLEKPEETEAYLDSIFDKAKDPLLSPEREKLTAEQIASLEKRRRMALEFLLWMSIRFGPVRDALVAMEPPQRRNGVLLIDRLCEKTRPEVFRRALRVTEGEQLEFVIHQLRLCRDTSLADAVKPLLRVDESRRSLIILYSLQWLSGQLDEMLPFVEARLPNGSYGIALDYARRAGQEDYATDAAIDAVLEFTDERAVEAARVLAQLPTDEARKSVMLLLNTGTTPEKVRHELLSTMPSFVPHERLPLLMATYLKGSRGYSPKRLVWQLKAWGLDTAKDLARSCGATDYLLWCKDRETIDPLLASVRSDNPEAIRQALPELIKAGLWDELPADWQEKMNLALEGTTQEQQDRYAADLWMAIHISDVPGAYELRPEILPIARLVKENSTNKFIPEKILPILAELGDRTIIPELEQRCADLPAGEAIFYASALYRLGQTERFDKLCQAARSPWLRPAARHMAMNALADSPPEFRKRALSCIADVLLDREWYMSEIAFELLSKASKLEGRTFTPVADDVTRRGQSAHLIEWVNSLQ